jgi:HAD superfamily hydrolase (TIGR01459 family)
MRITGLRDVIGNYSSFIIDVYGVLHDGFNLYPGVAGIVEAIKHKNKIFLSNAPRPAEIVGERIASLGLDIPINNIFTSGDFFRYKIQNGLLEGKKIFLIGEESNHDLLKDMKFNKVNNMKDANAAIILMFVEEGEEMAHHLEQLEEALSLNLEIYCPNPDKIVWYGSRLRYTGGYFADKYEKMGGKVHYFGKPHKDIYDHIIKTYNLENTMAIGDSLETDITGANSVGIDSALLLCGVHQKENDIEKLIKQFNAKPTYITQSFKL